MTATPIPRTLALTTYGDMDVSRIRQKPAGRKPIQTRVLPMDRMDQVIDAVRRTIDEGHKVYWVCPLVVRLGKGRSVGSQRPRRGSGWTSWGRGSALSMAR